MQIQKLAHIAILSALIVAVLILGKDWLIPIVLAVFIWFIIREIRHLIKRVKFIRDKIPNWTVNLVATFGLFAFLGLVFALISANVAQLSKNVALYETNLNSMILLINDTFGIDIVMQLKGYSGELDISLLIRETINMVSVVFGNIFIIVIYILFLMLEESGFPKKLSALYSHTEQRERTENILQKIDKSIGQYLFLKTIVSLITGTLSFVVLEIMGINGAFFWAFIIFVLNYIPTIGSLIASLFPAIFALLQFGEWTTALWVLGIIGIIQVVVGNFLEPKIMGNSLNISALVVILSLGLWGSIWGIVGMILSVPITVIMLILFAEFESTKGIAILLSEKGRLKF